MESIKYRVKNWWVSLLVGVLALAVGVMSTVEPIVTIGILTTFFIAYFFVSGIFEIFFAISNRNALQSWGWVLAGGIINFVFAIILLSIPIGSMLIFIYYVSFYILLQAFTGMWGAWMLRRYEYRDWWMYFVLAVLGLIFALLLIFKPMFAASFITIIFAASMICYGLFRIFYAFKLKKIKDSFEK